MTSAPIKASAFWNPTGIRVEAGQRYDVLVPADQAWCHGSGGISPRGESLFLISFLNPMRRMSEAPWGALIGTVDRSHPFLIGGGLTNWAAPASGEIVAYANDVCFAYWNNAGSVRFLVVPVDPTRKNESP